MDKEKLKNSAELNEQDLISVAVGTTENFDLDKALKENEEWMKNNGFQMFGFSGTQGNG